ncbi:hypothetical protein [Mycobacteroides abscessus]|uniref:Uncharacterized protein n=1 Tax=Mycobacteroides abscessus subsp. bolletii CRM-0020 TaxID=1306401 RepID=A0A829HNA3_9MYCO|nr:hypothetical protein [Mycobacteroides abscessus]EPQ21021.1 hypothetical protein J108_23715 [Mycobacteroides abscessus subsp. bolletii CRM-0020]RIS37901.1 hypothetical protein D2E71_25035 [Mycobacteroides abscessus]RIS77907.1 hypothetical protein D2E54_15245 [Mycobacteroides abscessus]SKQ73571.1 Uncharacterised protein [Mycobacteroides abscessus subsp. massiliense]SLE99736.1 Uncharacterised protein [Mycobacteroides abscessus subsp. massiliense]
MLFEPALALTGATYGALVDIMYRPDADAVTAWVLRDRHGQPRNWHQVENRSPWRTAEAAFVSFVPDHKQRHDLAVMGWKVEQTQGIDELRVVLALARGEATTDPTTGEATS